MIGINKATVNNIKVLSIDVNKLNARENVKWLTGDNGSYPSVDLPTITGEEQEIHCIKIKDGYVFDRFYFGVTRTRTKDINTFCVLELGVKALCGDDMYPVNIEAYKRMLQETGRYIEECYGIRLNFNDVGFKEIEINNTFKLDSAFGEYINLLDRLKEVAPKRYKKSCNSFIRGINLANGTTELKIYDKKYQLKQEYNFKINDEVMRIEYTFKNPQKIQTVLGTNKLNELTDEAIKQCINKCIEKDLIKGLHKELDKNTLQKLEYIQRHLQGKGA